MGLAWHSLLEACRLFTVKSRHREWKVGCAWKERALEEENVAHCVSFNAQKLQKLFLFCPSTPAAVQIEVWTRRVACLCRSDFCLVLRQR